jgi:hypothetical protein
LAVQTLALKDNTAALNKVVAENEALKARLGALEGTQPAAVKARASQTGGVTADQLPDSVKELVTRPLKKPTLTRRLLRTWVYQWPREAKSQNRPTD